MNRGTLYEGDDLVSIVMYVLTSDMTSYYYYRLLRIIGVEILLELVYLNI